MKKMTLVLVACSALFVACKKDYTCKCTVKADIPGFGTISVDSSYVVNKTTKKKAKSNCTDTQNKLKPEVEADGGTITCAINE